MLQRCGVRWIKSRAQGVSALKLELTHTMDEWESTGMDELAAGFLTALMGFLGHHNRLAIDLKLHGELPVWSCTCKLSCMQHGFQYAVSITTGCA